ncbi:MAG TPA: hypothetical protein VGB17_04515 [Pyrinomonadaceae bacterium]|jgi:hypothetical protein
MNDKGRLRKGLESGVCVVLVLHSPREKCWGLLERIDAAGVFLRGLDLNSFDDLMHAVAHEEPFFGVADLFFPMWRVERVTLDERAGEVPSLAEQFEKRTGRSALEFLGAEADSGA